MCFLDSWYSVVLSVLTDSTWALSYISFISKQILFILTLVTCVVIYSVIMKIIY